MPARSINQRSGSRPTTTIEPGGDGLWIDTNGWSIQPPASARRGGILPIKFSTPQPGVVILEAVEDGMARLLVRYYSLAGFSIRELLRDPGVRLLHARPQRSSRFPMQDPLDVGVVTVAACHALGSLQVVGALQSDSGDIFYHADQVVDGDELARTEIDRGGDQLFRVSDAVDTLDAIVDIAEASRLRAVAPDVYRVSARVDRLDHFAANGGGGLLAAAEPGALRTVDI